MHLWKYTDDAVIGVLMLVWAVSKFIQTVSPVEDEYMLLALGYVFGNIVQKMKIYKEVEE